MSLVSFSSDLEAFGFSTNRSGGHMSRSMMLDELLVLQNRCPQSATRADFQTAIEQDNALGKPTFSSRQKSFRHLVELYGLDPQYALFRNLRMIGSVDPQSFPLSAAICVFCRDPQLRASFDLIGSKNEGAIITRSEMEEHLERNFPGRFSAAMKKSLAQNVNTTWTVCGHLTGRSKKTRTIPRARFGSVCYAAFAGWLSGLRGDYLLNSIFANLVAADSGAILSALRDGSAHGWLRFRSGGGVTEIDFSPLLNENEIALLHGPH
jgi:hypothetical protein